MKTKAALWPIALVMVLAVTVAANGFILYEANRGTAAFEPDYYRKAVQWDSTMAQATVNARLRWTVTAGLDRSGRLVATVADSGGAIIADADVTVEGFPIAYENGGFTTDLVPGKAGYEARVALAHGGLHELRFTVTRGADRFTAALRGAPDETFAAR